MSRSRAGLVLLVVMAFAVSGCKFDGAYDLPLPGKQVSDSDGFTVTADFADVLDVVPRTTVMVNDVPIGQVASVDRVGWHARIKMVIRKDVKLPDNTIADIRQTSLLGEKYVALLAPSKAASRGRLADGDVIPLSQTGRNPEVEEVLGALSFLLSGGGVGQLKTISTELNKMLGGRTENVRHLLGQLDQLVGTLDDQKGDIIAALDSINHLTGTLNRERQTVGTAIDSLGPALKTLNNQHKSLIVMLRQLDQLGTVGTRVINGSKDNIVATLRHLEPVLKGLSDAGDSLPRGLSLLASFPFPKEAADIAKGDYANALFHLDINLDQILRDPLNELPDPLHICDASPALCQQVKNLVGLVLPTSAVTGSANNSIEKPSNPLQPDLSGLLGHSKPKTAQPGAASTSPAKPKSDPLGLGGLLGLLGGGG